MNDLPMLLVEGVHVDMGGMQILRGVSLTIPEGGVVGLVGRNGAGKTTTLRAIMGLVACGCVAMNLRGCSLAGLPAHDRARLGVGYAPEGRGLVGAFSVEENLLLPAHVCGIDERIREHNLERVYALIPELAELRSRSADSISGGQQKMAALGRALMIGSRLLLLDEPFQGLSPALARRYAETLNRLHEESGSPAILVTESNPALLAPLVQSCYAIERGSVELVGL